MKSSDNSTKNNAELGRAIARGVAEQNAQKQRNMAVAAKRKASMLEKAAERALFGRN